MADAVTWKPMAYAIRVKGKVKLQDVDTDKSGGFIEADARKECARLGKELEELQELLFAAGTHSLLLVLQGRDTAGKDGAIRGLSHFLNVQGCHVKGFKVPTAEELAHDFLWRVHPHAPAKGMISIFNRSHYEDVLVVRVHGFAPEEVWKKRYDQINEFESLLASNDTIVVKVCLHISKKEQERRLLEREKDSTKAWKLNVGDWQERDFWNEYTEAYNDALSKCNSDHAPWHIVPADHKWFRDLAITTLLVEALKPYKKEWTKRLAQIGEKAEAALTEYRNAPKA